MKSIYALFLFAIAAASIAAQPIDLGRYRGQEGVLVILAESRDDTRTFEFNLAVSMEWNRLEARHITTLDVDPTRYQMDAAFEQLGLSPRPFLIVLLDPSGAIVETTEDPTSLSQLLMAYDMHREDEGDPR